MLVSIDQKIFEKYPEAEIGYLIARVAIKKNDPFVDNLKLSLKDHITRYGLHPANFVTHPAVAKWKEIYEQDFAVNTKTYRSSLEALLKRLLTGKSLWTICNVVDLYNCCSVLSLLPMGGYDLQKIQGNISIRYAKEAEPFLSLGEKQPILTSPHHVVYADDQNILCWLWNHKDSSYTCIDEHSTSVIFFIDAFESTQLQNALKQLAKHLEQIDGTVLETGILNSSLPNILLGDQRC